MKNIYPTYPKTVKYALLAIALCLCTSGLPVREQIISLPGRELSVEKAINAIESQTDIIIGVNHENFDISRSVNFDSESLSVVKILDTILAGTGHTYLSHGNHILIVRSQLRPAVSAAAAAVSTEKSAEFEMIEGTIILRDNEIWDQTPIINEYTTINFQDPDASYAFSAGAGGRKNNVIIRDINIHKTGSEVNVGFNIETEQKAVTANQAIIITPFIESAKVRHDMTSIYMSGRKHELSEKRRSMDKKTGTYEIPEGSIIMSNGKTMAYSYTLPDSIFTPGTTLSFESQYTECRKCGYETHTTATNFVAFHRDVTIPPAAPYLTVGDRIAMDYPFVEADQGITHIRPDRNNALTVYFHLDKYDLRFDYRDNNRKLSQMIAAINIIAESDDSEITHVVLSGFASPEGPLKRNELLGEERVKAVRDFLALKTSLSPDKFVTFNGASDWEGLRALVEASNHSWKKEVLEIIETTPEASRMQAIKQLDGGRPYKYMLENILPDLRSSSYIKVYYRNK